MPESRNRLPRPIDISSMLPNAARRVHLMVDEPGLSLGLLGTPVQGTTQLSPGASRGTPLRRGNGSPAAGRGSRRSPLARGSWGRRTVYRGGRGRGRARTVLPSWYPRRPLGDITPIVRAIESRRAQSNSEATVIPDQHTAPEQHDINLITPQPARTKVDPEPSSMSPIWNILAKIEGENGKLDGPTPQKKLLNSIDKVTDLWFEEQRRMESMPAAKRVDRAKKLKMLMSMR
ncbi:POLYCHOME-like protein [Drosera capensis]